MSKEARGLVGLIFLVAAVVVAILNLRRVADLGVLWLSPLLLVVGVGFLASSKRRQ